VASRRRYGNRDGGRHLDHNRAFRPTFLRHRFYPWLQSSHHRANGPPRMASRSRNLTRTTSRQRAANSAKEHLPPAAAIVEEVRYPGQSRSRHSLHRMKDCQARRRVLVRAAGQGGNSLKHMPSVGSHIRHQGDRPNGRVMTRYPETAWGMCIGAGHRALYPPRTLGVGEQRLLRGLQAGLQHPPGRSMAVAAMTAFTDL